MHTADLLATARTVADLAAVRAAHAATRPHPYGEPPGPGDLERQTGR